MSGIHRRRTLYLAGAGMAALAGCSGSSDDPDESDTDDTEDDSTEESSDDGADGSDEIGEYEGTIETGDLPSYASLLPDNDRSEYFYGAIDFETMLAIADDSGEQGGEEPTDPLIVNPLEFVLMSFGAVPFSENSVPTEAELVYANDVYAISGEYDRESIGNTLEEAGYETVDTTDSYAIYTREEATDVVGITNEAFAFPDPNTDDPVDAVRRLVRTAVGERDPKHLVDEEFEWLLRAGGNSGISTGIYTDADEFDASWLGAEQSSEETEAFESDYDAFEGAYGAHHHLVLETDAGARAGAIVTYADEDRVDTDRLESSLGTEADSVELTRDETAVSVDAEYSGDL